MQCEELAWLKEIWFYLGWNIQLFSETRQNLLLRRCKWNSVRNQYGLSHSCNKFCYRKILERSKSPIKILGEVARLLPVKINISNTYNYRKCFLCLKKFIGPCIKRASIKIDNFNHFYFSVTYKTIRPLYSSVVAFQNAQVAWYLAMFVDTLSQIE